MLKPEKFSQAHFLPSIILVVLLLVLFVWSIGHAINYAITQVSIPSDDDCSSCGIRLDDQ